MRMVKKELIILPAFTVLEELNRYLNKSNEILALTPYAMLSLDNLNIPYRTPDYFYSIKDYRNDLFMLNNEVDKLFSELDDICKEYISFPYAYSGNIYWFKCLLADLLFIENLYKKIREAYCYDKIRLFSFDVPSKIVWHDLKYSDLKLLQQAAGFGNKIRIFQEVFHADIVRSSLTNASNVPWYVKARGLLRRAISSAFRRKSQLKKRFLEKIALTNHCKIKLFVIQGEYEIRCLEKYMPEVLFVNPSKLLNEKITSYAPANYEWKTVNIELDNVLRRFFPKMYSLLKDLFSSYHQEVVGRLGRVKKYIENLIEEHNPRMILFSIGAHQTVESLFAYTANKRNIPVVYFQHGGAGIFVKHPYQKHIERNYNIEKTLILNSQLEIGEATDNRTECVALGSIRRYDFINNSSNAKKNGGALYCCGPFPYYTYKELTINVSDLECYKTNCDVISSAKKYGVAIDIKLHPVEQDLCFQYFNELIRSVHHSKARVIYGIAAESIMPSYRLLIFEYLPSALFPLAIALNRPIVLYLRDVSVVNPAVCEDLQKRCYVVQNREMLNEVLDQYRNDRLPTKWSKGIVDKYVYPIKKGNPGPIIANYLKSVCEI